MAVACLESGYGASGLAKEANNLFGIKGNYEGQSVTMPTTEYKNGKPYKVNAAFRKYPSFKESIADFCALMKNGVSWDHTKYSRAVVGKTDLTQICYDFSKSGYMTDPAYSGKLLGVIKSENLQQYDIIPQIQKPQQKLNVNTSVVDFLKSKGMDSSFAACALLARRYHIQPYTGTAAENIQLLAKLKEVYK
jgi:flagellum-specific peptidoglycan hydrolase FlgJ